MSSDSHNGIAAALAAAQAEMEPAAKDARNTHFKNSYATLASVMAAAIPALTRHGIAVYQPVTATAEGARVVVTILHHGASNETLRDDGMPLITGKNDMQGLGSAITYARRYGLMAMCGIAPEDDDGAAAGTIAPPHQQGRPREPDLPPFDPGAARDRIKAKIGRARTLDELRETWGGERRVLVEIGTAMPPMYAELVAAKDERKAALTGPDPAGQAPAESPADAIPY